MNTKRKAKGIKMKKIICLILALACCFTFFACGETDETLEAYLDVVNATNASNITTKTTHTRGDVVYKGMYETEITEDGFVFTYEYEEKAPVVAGSTTGSVVTKSGEIVYNGEYYVVNGGEPTTSEPGHCSSWDPEPQMRSQTLPALMLCAEGAPLCCIQMSEPGNL